MSTIPWRKRPQRRPPLTLHNPPADPRRPPENRIVSSKSSTYNSSNSIPLDWQYYSYANSRWRTWRCSPWASWFIIPIHHWNSVQTCVSVLASVTMALACPNFLLLLLLATQLVLSPIPHLLIYRFRRSALYPGWFPPQPIRLRRWVY